MTEYKGICMQDAKQFLLACMSGQLRNDPKPYMTGTIYSAPASPDAWAWAKVTFLRCFPSLTPTIALFLHT